MAVTRVLLVDHLTLPRQTLANCLRADQALQLVDDIASVAALSPVLSKRGIDVVLLAVDDATRDAMQSVRVIMAALPGVHILTFAEPWLDSQLQRLLKEPIDAWLSRRDTLAALRDAMTRAMGNQKTMSDLLKDRLATRPGQTGMSTALASLSPRELQVLRLVATGMPKKQIADQLGLSVKTVENHSAKLMRKLDLHDRVTLTRYAIREGLAPA